MSEAAAEDGAGAAAAAAPRRGDKPPKAKAKGRGGKRAGAGRPRGAKNKTPGESASAGKLPAGAALQAQDRALIAGLATVLTLPAVPAVMFTPGDDGKAFMGGHFAATGPATAAQLVELSHQSPELREILMKLTEGGLWTGLATLAVCYVGPPVLWSIGKRGAAQAVEAFATMDPTEMAQAMAAAQGGGTMPGDADPASAEAQQREAADAARQAARPAEPGTDPPQQ